MNGKGVVGDLRVDWPSLMRFKRSFTDLVIPAGREKAFEDAGMTAFHARASFVSPTEVQAGDDVLQGRDIAGLPNRGEPAAIKLSPSSSFPSFGPEGETHD